MQIPPGCDPRNAHPRHSLLRPSESESELELPAYFPDTPRYATLH